MDRWPNQIYALKETLIAIERGQRKNLLTSPTGGGKTVIMADLSRHYLDAWKKVALYTNRKMLLEQTSGVMAEQGFTHGVRAAGYSDERQYHLQVCSIQTENHRVLRSKRWELHDADLVLVDEAHLQKGEVARKILATHYEAGAAIVGLTATPIDLGDMYDNLIVAGTTSELRSYGALVPAFHYGPDEPDLKHIKKVQLGVDLTEKQNVKAMMVPGIFARVFEWWKKLNPHEIPSILFGPGVGESIWFAEQFAAQGIRAAHIDGEDVWIDGELHKSNRDLRAEILKESKNGAIKILCNRFVLREGIDAPWLCHGIFATVFGSLQSYLQSGGRLLRSHPGCQSITIQDHGGNWWRHGSLNADREWNLNSSSTMIAGLREDRMREKKEAEPVRCPQCGLILSRSVCACGFRITGKSRPVIQSDGSLKEMRGDIFRKRRLRDKPDNQKIWERMYYRSLKADMTFRQAEALFAVENHWSWPPRTLPLMPTSEHDWFKLVKDVPRERLRV